MRKDYIGTIDYKSSPAFQNYSKGICKCLKAEQHDISVVEVIKLHERVDMKHEEITIAESRAEQSRVRVIGSMDNRLDHTFESANRVYDADALCPTIPTCGGGGIQPKVIEVMKLNDDKIPVLLGGVGKENEFGKQYRQGNRVYDSEGTAMAVTSQPIGNAGGNSYLYLEKKKIEKVGFIDNGTGQHQSNTVYGTDGVSPGLTTIDGGTQQIKVVDAQALRMVRTEKGKELRKAYENHEIHHGFNEHRQAEPREDGCANTLSTVLKDNHIVETQKISTEDYVMDDGNFNQRGKVHPENGECRTIMGSGHAGNEPKVLQAQQIVAMRGRNPDNPSDRTAGIHLEQRLEPKEEGICNCLTSVQKDNMVLESAIIDDTYKNREPRVYKDYSPALRSEREGLKTVKTIKIKQATKEGFVDLEIGGVVDLEYPNSNTRRGRVIDGGQVAPTTTTTTVPYLVELGNPDFYNFLYEIDGELYLIRIRKLIPLECFRLMAVSNKDAEKMLSVNSNTQCYKQAGNSIVVTVLMGIFSQLGISGVRRWNDMTEDEINQMIVGCR